MYHSTEVIFLASSSSLLLLKRTSLKKTLVLVLISFTATILIHIKSASAFLPHRQTLRYRQLHKNKSDAIVMFSSMVPPSPPLVGEGIDNMQNQDAAAEEDIFWAFEKYQREQDGHRHSDTISNHAQSCSIPPSQYVTSSYGKTYIIDLTPNEYKQVKQKRAKGESSTRFVYNLGALKMKTSKSSDDAAGRKRKILCLHRHKIWWMKPSFLSNNEDDRNDEDHHDYGHTNVVVPPETIFLFGLAKTCNYVQGGKKDENKETSQEQDQDIYRLVLPLVMNEPEKGGCTSCSVRSSSSYKADDRNVNVELHSETGGKVALYCGIGSDPYKLIEDGMQMASFFGMNHIDSINSTVICDGSDTATSTKIVDEDMTRLSFDKYKDALSVDTQEHQHQKRNSLKEHTTQFSSSIVLTAPVSINVLPYFANKLGWCTWNAFYTQLDGEKIISAVRMLQDREIPIKWIIIDDGWQHTTNDKAIDGLQWGERLLSVNKSSPSKFSDETKDMVNNGTKKIARQMSLKETVAELKVPSNKKEFLLSLNKKEGGGLEAVLAWHALPGYWLGLANKEDHSDYYGPATTLYYPHFSTNIIESDGSLLKESSILKGIGVANNSTSFYDEYHSFLQYCGFDGVKVDAQGVSGFLRPHESHVNEEDYEHRHQVSYHLQDALAKSINQRFIYKGNSKNNDGVRQTMKSQKGIPISPPSNIMCMCHSIDIIYRLPCLYDSSKPIMRASDDFYPKNDYCHGPHLVACAFNSLLVGQLATPDWDMFTTESTLTGEMHAIARAVSGGPIYFSDEPDKVDPSIVKRLACENGSILPCCTYARPTRDSLLNDPLDREGSPLILWNVNGHYDKINDKMHITSGLLAIFHLEGSGRWCYRKLDFVGSKFADKVLNTKLVKISPRDIDPFKQQHYKFTKFVAMSFQDGILGVLPSHADSMEIEVDHLKATIIHMLPMHQVSNSTDAFVVGIADLYNSAGAVRKIILDSDDESPVLQAPQSPNIMVEKISNITIHANGCGYFLVGYKSSAGGINVLQVLVDGKKANSWLFNPRSSKKRNQQPILPLEYEELARTFEQKNCYLHCIEMPCYQKNNNDEEFSVISIKLNIRTP